MFQRMKGINVMTVVPRFRIRTLLICMALSAITICTTLRIYHSFVPRGASAMPYLLASVDGGTIESPNGTVYEVWFNNAGAAHSGAHWTWIVETHLVHGKRVVTEGYLGSEFVVENRPIPISWNGEIPVIQFQPGRYGN